MVQLVARPHDLRVFGVVAALEAMRGPWFAGPGDRAGSSRAGRAFGEAGESPAPS